MNEFNLSHKTAMMLLKAVPSCIVVLSVVCVLFDKDETGNDAAQEEKVSYTKSQIVDIVSKTNQLVFKQNEMIGEMSADVTGILGIAKGTLEVSPSISPTFKPGWRKPKLPQAARKDTLTIENKVNMTDSIFISIGVDGDTIKAATGDNGLGNSCCCCKCCCKNCHKEGCR